MSDPTSEMKYEFDGQDETSLLRGTSDMKNTTELNEVNQQYAAAYFAHYKKRDLARAMQLYQQIMVSYPRNPEAEYSRMQIQNIVNSVVPRQERLNAQIELAMIQFEQTL